MGNQRYDSLLLDHDGVLVTLCSRSTLRAAARDAFADVGVDRPAVAAVDDITIRVSPGDLRSVAERYALNPGRLWRAREDRIKDALTSAVETGEKVPYDDVACLESVSVPLGVVSNNQQRIVEHVLEAHGLDHFFETVHARPPTLASLDDKKPAPTYLKAAAGRLGSSNPLFVGDSDTDVIAGQRAGFETALLRRSHNAERDFDVEPTVDASSLDDIVAEL
jgi:phosphoglycolate phosphatase-like HAD superfamily hydrolase